MTNPKDETEATSTSIYFADPSILERVDDLVESTGLSRNKILTHIIAQSLKAFEKNPALLIKAA